MFVEPSVVNMKLWGISKVKVLVAPLTASDCYYQCHNVLEGLFCFRVTSLLLRPSSVTLVLHVENEGGTNVCSVTLNLDISCIGAACFCSK